MSSIPFVGRSALLALCLAFAFAPSSALQASSITTAAQEYNGLSTSSGTELPIGNQIRVGFFDLSDQQIIDNRYNLVFLQANFVEIGRLHVGDAVAVPGHFQTGPLSANATQLGVDGKQIYLWVLKTEANVDPNATLSDVQQHGIFYATKETSGFDNWRIRPDAEIPNSTHVELAELTNRTNTLVAAARVPVGNFPVGVSTANSGASNFGLDLVSTLGPIPASTTLAATNITLNGAKLHATVNPNGLATTVEFFLSGVSKGTVPVPAGSSPVDVELDVTGLLPHTTYQISARATNSEGSTQGAKVPFTTLNTNPTAGDSSINLASNAATATIDLLTLVADADNAENFSFSSNSATGGTVAIEGSIATFTQNAAVAGLSFAYQVADGFGGTASGTVTVNDVTNPTLTIAQIPTTGYHARQRLTAAFVPAAARSDNSGFTTVTLNPPLGSLLTVGSQQIAVTITDPKGNSVSQNVTITAGPEVATTETAAKKGGLAGTAVPGATWFSFGYPAINNARQLAFTALLGVAPTASVTKADDNTLFLLDDSDEATLIAREGKTETVSGSLWVSFSDPVLNNSGHVAFSGKLKTNTGNTSSANDDILYSTSGGTAHIVAREGGDAQLGGPVFASFLGLVLPDTDRVMFLAKVKKGIAGSPAVSSGNDVGIWVEDGAGSLIKIVREGDTLTNAYAAGGAITTLEFLPRVTQLTGQTRSFNDDGAIIFRAKFTNKRTGIFTAKLVANVPTFTKVAVDTETVASEPTGATWKLLGQPMIDSAGTGALQGTLTIAGTVTKDNDLGLFADNDPQRVFPFVREGDTDDAAGATNGKFLKFSEILSPLPGSVAFYGTLKTDTLIKSTGDTGIWAQLPAGPLKLIAREGGLVPDAEGATNGPVFSTFTSLALPPDGRAVFLAKIKTGAKGTTAVKSTDDTGIWVINSEGLLKQALREGTTPQGVTSAISVISIFPAPLMVHGQARDYNENGDLAFRATLKDGSTAIFRLLR